MTPEFDAEFLKLVRSIRHLGELIEVPRDQLARLEAIEHELKEETA